MSRNLLPGVLALLAATAVSGGMTGAQAQQPAPSHTLDMVLASPESVGFSSARLEHLHTFLEQAVEKKQVAGVVTILARHGKVVDYRAYGMRDLASATPMTKDSIFRIYSMTKPTTGVAMMLLYEQGMWLPSEPISKFIPEFAHLKVFKGYDEKGNVVLVDPDHPPTMRELMTHTAGFTYGEGQSPVDQMYRDEKVLGSATLQEMIDKLAKIPLLYQPGTKWVYSASMDIQGYIVEKLSGQSLPDFDRDHIFAPLGMKDSGFYVPADKLSRFATLYENDGAGGVRPDTVSSALISGGYTAQPTMPSGGGGLVSTAEDYLHFAQMLGDGGELNGVRILAPSSVKLMTSNHLSPELLAGGFSIGRQFMRPGFGYGYNCAVAFDPPMANLSDGKGTFLWDGSAGTWFWVDPTNDIVFVGMIQKMNEGDPNLEYASHDLVYQALVDPAK